MDNPSLTISLAMVAGVLSQIIAGHLRIPGIIVLLTSGVLLGPDVANLVRPHVMDSALPAFVGFAVAIILFEGGLQMNLKRLRKQARPIRRLVTLGALVTAAGGAVAARVAMGWDWKLSALFGTLVIVTGPTVITPLLRRFHVRTDTATILEAEGIFIDAVGATIAVVALEVALIGTAGSAAVGVLDVLWRLGIGAAVGAAGGALLALLIRWRNVVPTGLENILSLSIAIAVFHIANSIVHESGITAAIVAGMVISNTQSHAFEEIVEFKEQLTVFSIATLFVLLAADVRVDTVIEVAPSGLVVVALLIFVVRPITVLASTWGTPVTWQQKVFLSWLAPRGIVAAAVASLFATKLLESGVEGGTQMRALVFLVIAVTVVISGFTGGLLAKALGLSRPTDNGYLILGANRLARLVARRLGQMGQPVVLVDSSHENCKLAKAEGLDVLYGNGLEHRTMERGLISSRTATLALTPNESINFVYAQRVRAHYRDLGLIVALETEASGVTGPMVRNLPAGILFGGEHPLAKWIHEVEGPHIVEEVWEMGFPEQESSTKKTPMHALLMLALVRKSSVTPVTGETVFRKGDRLEVLVHSQQRTMAYSWLREAGFVPVKSGATEDAADEAEA